MASLTRPSKSMTAYDVASAVDPQFLKLRVAITGGYDYAPAINAALSSKFKSIIVPDSDELYYVNSSLLIPDDTVLITGFNATLVRNFSGKGSSIATIRNDKLSSTNRNKNIGLMLNGPVKAADSSKTGKHVVFWGVDKLKVTLKIRETYDDWATNFRDCTDTQGSGIDIDTLGSGIYTDGMHITGGKNYNFDNLNIKSGDDCISLTVETPEDTDIDTVTFSNASLQTARSSIIKMTTKTGTTPTIKNVTLSDIRGIGGTIGAGEAIVLKDEDRAGRISDIEIYATVDCTNGAGAGCRVEGVNNPSGKVTVLNPQGKGADLSYMIGGSLEVTVRGQRTAGISAITLAQVSDFDLTPNVEGAKLHGVAVGAAGLPVTNCRIHKGRIKGSVNTDIRLINAVGVDVTGNYCSGANGIIEDSGSDWNSIKGNDVRNVSGTKVSRTGAETVVRENKGFKTENRSGFQLNSTATTVTVNHGLAIAPSSHGIRITFRSAWGSMNEWHIENITPTSFDFVVDVAPGAVMDISFEANAPKNI